MKNKYPHIFEPMTIRRMTVKNENQFRGTEPVETGWN